MRCPGCYCPRTLWDGGASSLWCHQVPRAKGHGSQVTEVSRRKPTSISKTGMAFGALCQSAHRTPTRDADMYEQVLYRELRKPNTFSKRIRRRCGAKNFTVVTCRASLRKL